MKVMRMPYVYSSPRRVVGAWTLTRIIFRSSQRPRFEISWSSFPFGYNGLRAPCREPDVVYTFYVDSFKDDGKIIFSNYKTIDNPLTDLIIYRHLHVPKTVSLRNKKVFSLRNLQSKRQCASAKSGCLVSASPSTEAGRWFLAME